MTRLALLTLASASVAAATSKYDAIQKVIERLEEMHATGAETKQSEEVTYNKFAEWARLTERDLHEEIERNTVKQGEAKTKLEAAAAEVSQAQMDIKDLNAKIHETKLTKDSAQAEKNKVVEDFEVNQANLAEALLACENAIGVLEAQSDAAMPAAFLQFSEKYMKPSSDRTNVLLQQLTKIMDPFKSPLLLAQQKGSGPSFMRQNALGEVIKLVENLSKEFEEEQGFNKEDHVRYMQNYESEQARRTDEIRMDEERIAETTKYMQEQAAIRDENQKIFDDMTATLEENNLVLEALQKEIADKDAQFEQNQKDRSGEMEAIQKAIQILSDSAAGGLQGRLTDAQSVNSFIQLSSRSPSTLTMGNLAAVLRQRSASTKAQSLAQVAVAVEAGGPLTGVIGMIRDMIGKLETDSDAEMDAHLKCKKEYERLDRSDEKLSQSLKETKGNLERLRTDEASMAASEAETKAELAATEASLNEATNIRMAEEAENNAIIADSKAGVAAVTEAIGVLNEFYGADISTRSAITDSEITENESHLDDETKQSFGGDYTGQDSGGVIGILEMVRQDGEKLVADKIAYEKQSKTDFKVLDEDMSAKILKLQTTSRDLGEELGTTKQAIMTGDGKEQELTSNLDQNSKEREVNDLSCQQQPVSYEERAAARQQEISSLEEALGVLQAGI